MTFFDKITELGYVVMKRTKTEILIKKTEDIANTYIYFNMEEQTLTGSVLPKEYMTNLSDVADNYKVFLQMKQDLITLKQLSGYAILNLL